MTYIFHRLPLPRLSDKTKEAAQGYAIVGNGLYGGSYEPLVKHMEIGPAYVIPTHCTGRDAVMQIEKAMPDRFILNMTGTQLTFSA